MHIIDAVLIVQALLGAFDNLWHHEWAARLPQQRGARRELALHATREALYGALFLGLAWWSWHGALAIAVAAVLAVEVAVTLTDFLEEDRTRQLPAFERWLHTVLTVCYGVFLGLMAPKLLAWWQAPTGLEPADWCRGCSPLSRSACGPGARATRWRPGGWGVNQRRSTRDQHIPQCLASRPRCSSRAAPGSSDRRSSSGCAHRASGSSC